MLISLARYGYLVVVLGPLLWLVAMSVQQPTQFAAGLAAAASPRLLGLLGQSTVFAVVVAISSGVVGLLAALVASQTKQRPWVYLRWLPVAVLATPPYVHTLVWRQLGSWLGQAGVANPIAWESSGWLGAGLVCVLVYMPVCYGLSLAGITALNHSTYATALLTGGRSRALWYVALPMAAPHILAGIALVFVLALTDYGVPSLFLVNSYALELFADYSAVGSAIRSLALSLPVVIIAMAGLLGTVKLLHRILHFDNSDSVETTRLELPGWLTAPAVTAGLLLVGHTVLPFIVLSITAGSWAAIVRSINAGGDEWATSFFVAIITGLCGVILAWPVSSMLLQERCHYGWWLAVVLPLAIPAPLIGTCLVNVYNTPLFSWVYGTLAMPVLAAVLRFTPVAVVVLALFTKRTYSALSDAARLYQHSRLMRFMQVTIPMRAPGLLVAASILALLSLNELGATLLVIPPGRSTVIIRLYNYLHYGAAESVAGLSLTLILASAVMICICCFVAMSRLTLRQAQHWRKQ